MPAINSITIKFWRCLGIALLLACSGCGPNFGWPHLHPGGFAYQRWRAEMFDPYPATDVGPTPAGMRPTWYETPPAVPARLYGNSLNRFGPPPDRNSPVMP
jgi:hypothetical protein